MVEYAWLIPVLPIISFLLIVFITRHISSKLSGIVSIIGIASSCCVALPVLLETIQRDILGHAVQEHALQTIRATHAIFELNMDWLSFGPVKFQLGMLIDPLSASMLAMVTFVATFIQIYSMGYMKNDPGFSRYFAFMSLFCAAMLGLVISNNLLLTFISWEIVGLCSYLLIGFWNHKKSAADAAKKAFIVTRLGDLGFILGLVILYNYTGTFNITELSKMPLGELLRGWAVTGIPLLIFCGAVGKSAQFPLHVWLPDAMEGPTPVSALIHAATMVAAGVYLVARIFFIFTISPVAMFVVAWIGAITAFIAATIALVQADIKKILAYSTISQLGYMVMALGTGAAGYTAGIFHLLSHAFFKALLFLGAGSFIHAMEHTGSHDPNSIWNMGGTWKKMPVSTITFLVGSLSISGIWPLSGFWSKDEVLLSAKSFHPVLYSIALITAFITAFYMWRLSFVAFFGKPKTKEAEHVHESPIVMTVPLIVLAVFAAVFGYIYTKIWPFSNFVSFSVNGSRIPGVNVSGAYHEAGANPVVHMDIGVMLTSSIIAILGIVIAYLLYGARIIRSVPLFLRPFQSLLLAKYYMDHFYGFLVKIFMFGVATIISFIDTCIVDNIVNFTGWGIGKAGKEMRTVQTGLVQHYAYVLYGGIVIIILSIYVLIVLNRG